MTKTRVFSVLMWCVLFGLSSGNISSVLAAQTTDGGAQRDAYRVAQLDNLPTAEQLEEWVARLQSGADLPVGIRFRQDVTAKVLFFTWRFHSDMVQESNGLKANTIGAPSIIPQTLATDLIDVVRSPASFNLQFSAHENGWIVLHGERIKYDGTGPKDATFWFDPMLFVIKKAEATYEWGKLYLEQEYAQVYGHTLLSSQKARVTPYGATLEVTYSGYHF